MTKHKFLSAVIMFFISFTSFGVDMVNSEKIVSLQIVESNSSLNNGATEINQEIEKISPPFKSKVNQKVKACHR